MKEIKHHDKYFEGYLQLRNCDDEVLKYVNEKFKEERITISKQKKQKNGIDYQISSNKFLMKLAPDLTKRFSGNIKITRKLFSQNNQTGKNIYRMTVLFEQINFKVGDVINDQGDDVKVISISSQKITVRNLSSGKKYFLKK